MIQAAISFFIIGLLAYVLGAYGIAGVSIELGKIVFVIALIFAILSFIFGSFRGRKGPQL